MHCMSKKCILGHDFLDIQYSEYTIEIEQDFLGIYMIY